MRQTLQLSHGWDMIRHVSSHGLLPRYHVLTDRQVLLCDLRMSRGPVLTLETGLGEVTPAAHYARIRLGTRDWTVVSDRWGDMRLSVSDGGHDTCGGTRQPVSDLVSTRCCEDSLPRVLTRGVTCIGGWGDTVARARDNMGAWMTPALEQRAGLPWAGLDIMEDRAGNIVIMAVNMIGDIFGKRLELKENDDSEWQDDEDDWLETWAGKVIDKSYLPSVRLKQRQYLLDKGPAYTINSLPLCLQTMHWNRKQKKLCLLGQTKRGQGRVNLQFAHAMMEAEKYNNHREAIQPDPQFQSSRSYKRLGMPSVNFRDWPEHLSESVSCHYQKSKDHQYERFRGVNVEKMTEIIKSYILPRKATVKLQRSNNMPSSLHAQSILHSIRQQRLLKPDGGHSSFHHIIEDKLTRGGLQDDAIVAHVLKQFNKVALGEYVEGSSDHKANKHSANILKILTGQLDHKLGPSSEARPGDDNTTDTTMLDTSSAPPVPPGASANKSFPSDSAAFWADYLGLPLPSQETSQDIALRRPTRSEVDQDEDILSDFEL